MDTIDITMTAVIRPKILSETLQTITKNVVKDQQDRFRLIINIDPIGEDCDPMKVVKVANKNFKNVLYNIPDEPSFPKAVKWVWSQVEAPFIFHWEDDVNILREIDVDDMMTILKKHKKLSSLRLYKHKTPKRKSFRTFSSMWRYNKEGFYVAVRWQEQFGLNPILIKKEFIDQAIVKMKDDYNPEKQFRFSQKYMRPVIQQWQYGLYTRPGYIQLVNGKKGQKWKNKMKLQKPKGKTFTKWRKT